MSRLGARSWQGKGCDAQLELLSPVPGHGGLSLWTAVSFPQPPAEATVLKHKPAIAGSRAGGCPSVFPPQVPFPQVGSPAGRG